MFNSLEYYSLQKVLAVYDFKISLKVNIERNKLRLVIVNN